MDKNQLGGSGNIKHMVEYRKDVADLALERLQEVSQEQFIFLYLQYNVSNTCFYHWLVCSSMCFVYTDALYTTWTVYLKAINLIQ